MLTSLFSNILLTSLMSVLLVFLIMAVKSILKDRLSASWHYYIWALLILRLAVPYTPDFSMDWAGSSFNKTFLRNWNYSTINNSGNTGKTAAEAEKKESQKSGVDDTELENTVQEENIDIFDRNMIPVKSIPFNVTETAGLIWAAGVIALTVYILLINILVRYRVRKAAIPADSEAVNAIIAKCCRLLNINRKILVVYQKHIKSPALFGLFRPRLLIPYDILSYLDINEMEHIILHELCHHKRKDILISTLLVTLNILHWFNPAIWFAFKRINEDREPACDKMALRYMNSEDRKKYAITLVKILEIFSGNYPLYSTAGIIQGRSENMAWRLKLIGSMKKKPVVLGIFAALLIIVLGTAGFGLLKDSIGFAKAPEAEPAMPAGNAVRDVEGRGVILDRNGLVLVQRDSSGQTQYPLGSLASHIIGYVDESGKGAIGIEAFLDSSGKASDNITLTIDKNIQKIAEDALEKAMDEYKLMNGATAVLLDPETGEILAMVSKPDFDLSSPLAAPKRVDLLKWQNMSGEEKRRYFEEEVLKNKAISEPYEPGSTFKAIVSAAGLEEGVVSADTPVDDTTVTVAGFPINCWRPNGHGRETFAEAVYNSCNPVFVRLAQELGKDRFYKYVREFGFYDKTGIHIPGEASSLIHKKPMDIDMAVAAFGHRFQITPLQLASAYGAVANGGSLLKPQLIKEIFDSKGQLVKKYEAEVLRKVISKQTSDELKRILEGAVEKGTGRNAYVEGYRIAGKTGTSETAESVTKGRYIASFAGFAPADNPKIVCLVVLDGPGVYPHTGGMTAAPVARTIIKEALDYMQEEFDKE